MRDAGESPPMGSPGADRGSSAREAREAREASSRRRLVPGARARREIILGLALLLCYGFFRQQPAWNEYSRYDLVRALVEDGTTRIDPYHENTGDKAFYQGHYFSDKAPGTSILGVPVYGMLMLTSRMAGLEGPNPEVAIHALAFGVSGISTVLLVLLLVRFLRPAVGERWALVIGLGYGLGSIAFPFATMFFGHAVATFFLFAAFYALWRAKAVGGSSWQPVVAGFLAGWAALVELTTMLGVVVLLLYALVDTKAGRRLFELNWRAPLLMVAGAAIPAAVLLAYNSVSFGGPFSLGYTNLAAGAFAEGMGRGLFGVSSPTLEVAGELLVGPRGLLRLAPWLVVAPLGLLAARRRGLRLEAVVCGMIAVAFLIFNAGYFLPFGGWTPGPRFLMPGLPFAAILVALAPRQLRTPVGILIAIAIAAVLVATATMPNAPEAFTDPYVDLWLSRFVGGDLAETLAWTRWGYHGVQPLFVLAGAMAIAGGAGLATLRAGVAARRLSAGLTGVLVLVVVAFAVPLAPVNAVDLAIAGTSPGPQPSFRVVEVGTVPVLIEDGRALILWAQLENRGAAIAGTRVVFTVYGSNGDPTWSAWHDALAWASGERKQLEVQLDQPTLPAGEYAFDVAVVSVDPPVTWGTATGVLSLRD